MVNVNNNVEYFTTHTIKPNEVLTFSEGPCKDFLFIKGEREFCVEFILKNQIALRVFTRNKEEHELLIEKLRKQMATNENIDIAMRWNSMEDAPRDGTPIVGLYDDGEEAIIRWSDRPVCILGSRNGGYPPGWATAGNDTDYNLPMDIPKAWRHE